MPLVAAAVLPHAPVLAPAIAAEHAKFTDQTRQAMRQIGVHFRAAQVETIVLITPHGPSQDERMSIISAERLQPDLRMFGDVSIYPAWKTNIALAQQLRASADEEHLPATLTSEEIMDYGCAIPCLAAELDSKATLVPLAVDHLSQEMIMRMGQILNEVFHRSSDRIGCIASADLAERTSRTTDPDRPTPWERSIATAIRNGRIEELPAPDEKSCGYSPIAVLLAALQHTPATAEIISFQAPFRVGYLVAEFQLQR